MTTAIDNAKTMTVTEYAGHRGVSQPLISRWKSQGRLVLDSSGRILVRASDLVLDQDMHPTKGGRAGSRAASEPAAPSPSAAGSDDRPGQGEGDELSLANAARLEKVQKVRLLHMEIEEKAGNLVSRSDVERTAFDLARRGQEALMGIADRLSPQLAAESDPHRVHVLLSDELRRVCELIASLEPQQAVAA
jgi:hypothetical protein